MKSLEYDADVAADFATFIRGESAARFGDQVLRGGKRIGGIEDQVFESDPRKASFACVEKGKPELDVVRSGHLSA